MAAHASSIESRNGDAETARSPRDELTQRLDDPQIASSLALLLDHADLVAILITGLDGFIRRAEVMGDSLSAGVAEVRGYAAANGERRWPSIDVAALSDTASRMSAGVVDAIPAMDRLLHSPLTDPRTAEFLAEVGEALLEGQEAAAADPRGPKGVFALMRVIKDPDVSRGLGLLIHIARAFGKRLAQPEPPKTGRAASHAAD